MKKATLTFRNIRLNPSQTHKFRGYVGNIFSEYDLIHNHDPVTGKHIYRYPLVQFKVLENIPHITALTSRAVDIFTDIFMGMENIIIEEQRIPIHEKDLKIETAGFGFSQESFMYEFVSPWLALNQKNYSVFRHLHRQRDKDELLGRILIGNILSMSKYLGLHLEPHDRIRADMRLKHQIVNLKGQKMVGFRGFFKTNFNLPDLAGLGKSISRGFGTVKNIL